MQLSCSTAGSIEGPFQFSNSKFGGSGEFQAGGWRRSIPVQDKAATKPQSSSAAQSSVTGSVDPVHKERAGELLCVQTSISTSTSNAAHLHRSSGRSMNGTPTAGQAGISNRARQNTASLVVSNCRSMTCTAGQAGNQFEIKHLFIPIRKGEKNYFQKLKKLKFSFVKILIFHTSGRFGKIKSY